MGVFFLKKNPVENHLQFSWKILLILELIHRLFHQKLFYLFWIPSWSTVSKDIFSVSCFCSCAIGSSQASPLKQKQWKYFSLKKLGQYLADINYRLRKGMLDNGQLCFEAVSSRSVELLNSMIHCSRWTANLRWMFENWWYTHLKWFFSINKISIFSNR